MKYDPDKHHRQSIRLKGYDYSSVGGYFITICTHKRECLFGEVVDGVMQCTPNIRLEIKLDAWIVMPNHFHGIVFIQPVPPQPGVGAQGLAPLQTDTPHDTPQATNIPRRKPRSLGALIAGFKMAVTKQINILRDTPSVPIWQRNYYEHIIRNEATLHKIREYVQTNPQSWNCDQLRVLSIFGDSFRTALGRRQKAEGRRKE